MPSQHHHFNGPHSYSASTEACKLELLQNIVSHTTAGRLTPSSAHLDKAWIPRLKAMWLTHYQMLSNGDPPIFGPALSCAIVLHARSWTIVGP